MKTTRKLLPAINSLYSMGLEDNEITTLLSNWAANLGEVEGESERVSKVKRDLRIAFKKGNILLHITSPFKSSYDKHNNVEITKLDLEDNADHKALNKKIEDSTIYYCFDTSLLKNSEGGFVFKSLEAADLDNLCLMHTFTKNFRSLHRLFKVAYESNKVYESVEDLRSILSLEIKHHSADLNTRFSPDYGITNGVFRKCLEHIFPKAQVTKGTMTKETAKMLRSNSSLRCIQTILEFDNYRAALNLKCADSYYSDSLEVSFTMVDHKDPTYNYADVDRLWYRKKSRSRYSETPALPFGDAMFINEDPSIPNREVLKDHFVGDREATEFVGNNDLVLISKRYTQKQNRLAAEQLAKEKLERKISDKLNLLRKPKGELKINDVVYTQNQITYQDQILKNNDGTTDWVYSLLRRQVHTLSLNRITFDHVFGAFVGGVRRDKDYSPLMDSGHIGDVTFDITSRVLTNKNNISSTRYYVNGYRINTNEIPECIERAICYETQEDYNHFLKSVSSCSLKMHRYLQLGIDIRVRDDFDYTQVTLKFPLERMKNLNYLVINDTEYKVRDTNKIIRLEKAENIMEVINVLLSGEVVEGVEAADIKDIIEAGKQEYIDAVEKSKQLLKEAEDTLKIVNQPIELKDGTTFNGYVVKGHLRTYAVNAHDDRHSVYDIDTAQYICIVDKTNNAQVGKDRLVNRLFALANDKLVATKISTLKRSTNNG